MKTSNYSKSGIKKEVNLCQVFNLILEGKIIKETVQRIIQN